MNYGTRFIHLKCSTAKRMTLTLRTAELIYDTDLEQFFFGDGVTVGGNLLNGEPGAPGADGADGADGTDGVDGVDGVGVPVGGTTGQVLAKIDGTNYNTQWVTPSGGGGGGVWGAITGTLTDQTDLVAALATKQDSIAGSNNRVTYKDDSGVVKSLESYFIDTDTGSLKANLAYEPDDDNTSFSIDNMNIGLNPLQDSPNDTYNIRNNYVDFDSAETGFSLGINGTAIRFNNSFLFHEGTGNLGYIEFLQGNFQVGNGTDPINFRGFAYAMGFGEVRDNVTLVGNIQGYGFQPNISAGAIIDPGTYLTAFYDSADINCDSSGHTSFNAAAQIEKMQNNRNYTGLNVNTNIGEFLGTGSYTGVGVYGNLGDFGIGGYYAGVKIQPNISLARTADGLFVDMSDATPYAGVKATLTIQDLTFEFIQPGSDANSFTIEYVDDGTAGAETATISVPNIVVHIESGVSTATQIKAAIEANFTINGAIDVTVSGTGSNTQITQAPSSFTGGINAAQIRAAYFKGDVAIEGNLSFTGDLNLGKINAFATQTLVDGGGQPGSVHGLITNPTIGDNVTLANADLIGVNTACLLNIGENSVITTSFLGIAALGLPAVLTMKSGSTVDKISGAAFALSLDGTGTGGTIDKLSLCKAIAIPNGGITTVNEMYGYEMDLPFGDPGTQTWGVMIRPAVHNFMAGNLKIGGSDTVANDSVAFEIESSSKAMVLPRMDTTARNAMTAIAGMVIFNTTTNTLQYYDGSVWV